MNDILPTKEAEQKLLEDLSSAFEELEDDPTPIAAIHSTGYAEDGAFTVMLDMADGRTVLRCYRAGEPIPSVGPKPKPPTQIRAVTTV